MKRWIASLMLVQILGLLCFTPSSANTPAAQISETLLTDKFNAIIDTELSGETVCLTPSASRQLNILMANSARKIIKERAFNRVAEAEKNIKEFAKVLLANGTQQSGRTRVTVDTIEEVTSRQPPSNTGAIDPPDTVGGSSEGGGKGRFCPLFPIC
jgi:hypothetical protein